MIMPTSDHDLDDIIRSAMKTLDDEAPSGYFEALPDLTLARLEGTMQHGPQGTMDDPASPPPPIGDNTEDSGLHDIRNLAHSTKARLSSKRITTSHPTADDDGVASSSAGWKAVALPQPAKMVALPELTELPTKREVLAKEKAAAKVEKAAAKVEAKTETRTESKVEQVAAAAVEAPAAAPAKKPVAPQKSKTGLYAVLGAVVVAAAGAAIYVGTAGSKTKAPQVAQNTAAPAAVQAAPTVTPIATGSAEVSADVLKAQEELAKQEAEAERMKAELAAAQAAVPAEKPEEKKQPAKAKAHVETEKVETPVKKVEETKPPQEKKEIKKPDGTKPPEAGDPDFNELLKEAGVKDPAPKKPVLAKKELTGDDFKTGMASISGTAKGCYKGTQGTAMTKIVIAPSGKVSKVTVSGQFSGTPEGDCVSSAIKGASFPPWDGGPQSFTYPILLSE
jgi:hypothetical protein